MPSVITNRKIWQTVWYSLMAVGAIFGIVWTWVAAPPIWPTIASLFEVIVTAILGVAVTVRPLPPEPPA